jgi:hypothetical protein
MSTTSGLMYLSNAVLATFSSSCSGSLYIRFETKTFGGREDDVSISEGTCFGVLFWRAAPVEVNDLFMIGCRKSFVYGLGVWIMIKNGF